MIDRVIFCHAKWRLNEDRYRHQILAIDGRKLNMFRYAIVGLCRQVVLLVISPCSDLICNTLQTISSLQRLITTGN